MLSSTPLALSCYELMKQIPRGKVTTYKILAEKLGTGPRVIGRICGANPNIPSTPCHRVVRSDGKVDGYAHGTDRKIALLREEGIFIDDKHTIL
jgi:methylated-DNA-[protein]-cysteine S-methyltransferase